MTIVNSSANLDNNQPSSVTANPAQVVKAANSPMEGRETSANAQTLKQYWLTIFQRSTRLLMAAIAPGTLTLRFANDAFCQMVGIDPTQLDPSPNGSDRNSVIELLNLFSKPDQLVFKQFYRRHILHQVLQQVYHIELNEQLASSTLHPLDEPFVVSVQTPLYPEPRFLQFWFNSERIKVTRLEEGIDEFADLRQQKIQDAALYEKRLRLENYRLEGHLFLEGLDVTIPETIRRLTQLLIDRDSVLNPVKFKQVSYGLRSLFRATNLIILRAEKTEAQLSIGLEQENLIRFSYTMQSLRGSHFLRAAKANHVWNVADLTQDCQTDCERELLNLGFRSLLLIPLGLMTTNSGSGTGQLLGLVGLVCDRPNFFTLQDCKYASELILALTSALRQACQQQFTHIHPAVAWRFLQEAERRSWGLPPEPIVFTGVYPLYGISDIRGSSNERNRAIQKDLIAQFQLGLEVVEAVCAARETALGQQLKLDLLHYITRLQEKITVDAEVTAIEYLKENLEVYFDYFATCSEPAKAAIVEYQHRCANEHRCLYEARRDYDQLVNQINTQLQITWNRWQERMQKITPHYCDSELTDGMDHMIYTGASIDPNFTPFHLRSLRYEQLRAICDCARTAFKIQEDFNTDLQLTHLVLAQEITVDILHDEKTEKTFDVRGTRDTRYEIVKKRIDKAVDATTRDRITQPGMLTLVYSTDQEWEEYQTYLRYLERENWVAPGVETGTVEPLQGVEGLKFARVRVLEESP